MTKTKGTLEWAESNVNCYYGCSNNCMYCYAKRMALRFGRINSETEWEKMRPNYKNINKRYMKRRGVVMFPTSHDITRKSVDNYIIVLRKLLEAGNRVLITTKANFDCIDKVYDEVLSREDKTPNKYVVQVEFRFSIGSIHNKILKKYEPNAPPFYYERLNTLLLLTALKFKTSISIEPFLDKDPTELIKFISEYIIFKGDIWLGLMSGYVPEELKPNYTIKNLLKIKDKIDKLSDDIRKRIRYKDSIENKLKW